MTAMIGFNPDIGASPVGARKSGVQRPRFLIAGAVILLLAGGVYGVVNLVLSPAPPRMQRLVTDIALLPPPPPLPQVEQPPPPEVKEEVNIPEPETLSQDETPPGDLGLDADGNGSDGFQLRARKGGRDLLGAGGPFAWYADRIQESIYKILSANKKVRSANYVVNVNLWFKHDGSIDRFELASTTGNPELDKSLRNALDKVGPLGSELPPDLPQPVRLKIVSRN
jgi:protein TonB